MKVVVGCALFIGLYAVLTVPLSLASAPLSWATFIVLCAYSLLSLTMAADVTEHALALVWRPVALPRAAGPLSRRGTAILMTVCDDWNEHCLSMLRPLAAAGYSIFVLDDSADCLAVPQPTSAFARVVRRPNRKGAKGGNLNHWLEKHGSSFDYMIVLDADSMMPLGCADALLLTAQHTDNRGVAVFQSKIEPHNSAASLLAAGLAVGARPRNRILERVHASLGVLLSSGHNLLIRTGAVRQVGGFDENLTSEDTVLSLVLTASGWRIAMVDAWSSDAEPTSFVSLARRTTRWARQTVELLSRPWKGTPLGIKLLLCRHLLAYFFPVLATLLLIVSVWTAPDSLSAVADYMISLMTFTAGATTLGVAAWCMLAVAGAWFILRIALGAVEGLSWRRQLSASLVLGAVQTIVVLPLTFGLFASFLGRRVHFSPTGSRALSGRSTTIMLAQCAGSLVLVTSAVLVGAALNPGSMALGFNALWIASAVSAPVIALLSLWYPVREGASR